jgi:hypothetical protein
MVVGSGSVSGLLGLRRVGHGATVWTRVSIASAITAIVA